MIVLLIITLFVSVDVKAQELESAFRNLRQVTSDEKYINFDVELSPDGKYLVYASDRTDLYGDIVIQPLVGSTHVQKTFYEGMDRFPCFFPTGERIAFATDMNGNFDIFIMRTKGGTAKQQITSSDLDEMSPDVSPDGKSLAYTSYGIDGGNIWVYDFEDRSFTTLGRGEFPRFSPDGTSIVYQKSSSSRDRYYSIWVINVDGSSDTQVVRGDDWSAITPDWKPDGKYIVFASSANKVRKYRYKKKKSRELVRSENKGTDIWVVKTDGTGLTQLTRSKSSDWYPKWSKDNVIYFCSDRRLGKKPTSKAANIWSFVPLLVE